MFNFASLRFQIDLSGGGDCHVLFGIKNYFHDAFVRSSSTFNDHDAMRTVFGQELSTDVSALRRFQKPPLPFAFNIPLVPENYNEPEPLTISLSVAGSALNHLPVFILAVKLALNSLAAKNGSHIEVTRCSAVADNGHCYEVTTHGEGLAILSTPEIPFLGTDVRLEIASPLRLVRNGKMLRRLSFADFIRPLMRRVSALAYYYGAVELDLDFKWLSEASCRVESADDTVFVDTYPILGEGMLGSVLFQGVTADYYPFLVVGEYFNLGKGAAYGGGAFRFAGQGSQ